MIHMEQVRAGTLKLLSERIVEQREENRRLEGVIRSLRRQVDRYERDLRQKDGPPGVEAAPPGHRAYAKEGKTERMAPTTFG